MYSVGLDIGSVGTKAVLFNGRIAASVVIPTGWSPRSAAQDAYKKLLESNNLSDKDIVRVVSTGYGRNSTDLKDKAVTEITCHAAGAFYLNKDARTILDIGGQDSKVISIDDQGNVTDFLMNDKCAAGTGRFLQVMANLLGFDIEDFDRIAAGTLPQKISSMCTVFAESEVVSLLAEGVEKESIALGLIHSIAGRAASMVNRVGAKPMLVFTGGVSKSGILRGVLSKSLGIEVLSFEDSQIAGALGAAIIGWHQQ